MKPETWRVRIPALRTVTHLLPNGVRNRVPDEQVHREYELRECEDGWLELSPIDEPNKVYRLPESDIVQYFVNKDIKRVDGLAWP